MSHPGEDSTKVFVGPGTLPGKIPLTIPDFQEGTKGVSIPGNLQGEFRGKILPFQVQL